MERYEKIMRETKEGSDSRLHRMLTLLYNTKKLLAEKWVGKKVRVLNRSMGIRIGVVTDVEALWHVGVLEVVTIKLDSGGFLACSSRFVELV